MINLITVPFKVESKYTRVIERIIEDYFGYCQYEWDDGYVRNYEGDNLTVFKGYREYIINHSDEDYFDFTERVNLNWLYVAGDESLPEVERSKVTEEEKIKGMVESYVPLSYIFSLLTKQDISFYEIDIATYQGKKTTILSNGDIVTVNLQLSEIE
jgi:hypothetical protein